MSGARVANAPLRWGLLGPGGIAQRRLAPAIAADPNSVLHAVASRDAERARAFAAEHNAPHAYGDYSAMLANPDVDVVLITTPNALHAEQVIAAAQAGKHVFCDKPLATTAPAAQAAVAACRSAGVKLGINFESRHLPLFQDVRTWIAAGEIGHPVSVHIESGTGISVPTGWRADPALAGMGAVANTGVHLYDILRFVLDAEVVEVTAMLDAGQAHQVDVLASTLLRFDNRAIASVTVNQLAPRPLNDVVIHGSDGRIASRGLGSLAHLLRRPEGSSVTVEKVVGNHALQLHYDVAGVFERSVAAFSRAVLDGVEPNPSGADGLRSVQVMEAIAASAITGRTVSLPQTMAGR